MTEKIGQYFFRVKKGEFIVAPNPLKVINGEVTNKILRISRNRRDYDTIEYTTSERWWERADEEFRKDIQARGLDRRALTFRSMHTPCEV